VGGPRLTAWRVTRLAWQPAWLPPHTCLPASFLAAPTQAHTHADSSRSSLQVAWCHPGSQQQCLQCYVPHLRLTWQHTLTVTAAAAAALLTHDLVLFPWPHAFMLARVCASSAVHPMTTLPVSHDKPSLPHACCFPALRLPSFLLLLLLLPHPLGPLCAAHTRTHSCRVPPSPCLTTSWRMAPGRCCWLALTPSATLPPT
jgi:hypothetical protein